MHIESYYLISYLLKAHDINKNYQIFLGKDKNIGFIQWKYQNTHQNNYEYILSTMICFDCLSSSCKLKFYL